MNFSACRHTFFGEYDILFIAELKRLGHLPAFANIVIYINDQQNKEAEAWINANETKVRGYMDRAKAYRPPAD
ncbi:MAG: hypothetical protein M9893_11525 [Pyrinomonadaceae bacterium]|nr:hypothetical protein [Pyrinomonadaceae bacterium]